MKKKNFIWVCLLFVFLFFPGVVNAASLRVSVSCSDVTVNQSVTCSIRGNASGKISGIHGEYAINGGAGFQSFAPGSGWSGEGNSGSFDLYTDNNKTSGFEIGKITLKANKVGKVILTIRNLKASDDSFNEIGSISNATSTFYVKEVTTTTTTAKKTTHTTKQQTTKASTTKTTVSIPVTTEPPTTTMPLPELRLTSVTVDNFEVTFDNGIYYATVEAGTESVTINATAANGITIAGTGPRTLSVGKNSVELVLRNEQNETKTQQIIITRPDGDGIYDTKLTSLKVVDYDFAFNPDMLEYTITVPARTKEVYVLANSYSEDVIITGAGLKSLGKGEDTVYVKVSYGDLATTEYVIHIKKSNQMLFMWIGIGFLSISCIGLIVYSQMTKKNITQKAIADKNKVLAEENRREVQTASSSSISLNGEKVVGVGKRTVIPTQVVAQMNDVPLNNVVEAQSQVQKQPAVAMTPQPVVQVSKPQQKTQVVKQVKQQTPMMQNAPHPQIKTVKKTVVTKPKQVKKISVNKAATTNGSLINDGIIIKDIEENE